MPSPGPSSRRRKALEDRLLTRFLCYLHHPWTRYFRLRWEGLENVPEHGPAIVCPNHASHLDPSFVSYPIYWHRGKRLIRYMAVDIHFRGLNGLYRWAFDAFPVPADGMDREGYRAATSILEEGQLLGIFPEGARTLDGRLREFRRGAARLAARRGVPLLPVTLNGTFDVLPAHRRIPRRLPVEVIYHPLVRVDASLKRDETYLDDLTRQVRSAVAARWTPPRGTP